MEHLTAFLTRMPKVELHVHLESTMPGEMLARFAARQGRELPRPAERLYDCSAEDLSDFLAFLDNICSFVGTPEELAEYTRRLTAEQARQMDRALRRQYPGAAVLTTGGCTLCEECTRPMGRPCRHPQAVGYSLESLGCDVGAAARGELGWELLWPRRDRLPRYLTLLCAVLR